MRKWIFLFALSVLFQINAHAFLVVDTGPGNPDWDNGAAHFHENGNAIQFHLNDPFTVTDIDAWFYNHIFEPYSSLTSSPRELTMDIRRGNNPNPYDGPSPGPVPSNDSIFSQNFIIPLTETAGWYGVHDISLNLDAGDYWVYLHTPEDNWNAWGLSMPSGVPNPQPNYAMEWIGGELFHNNNISGFSRSTGLQVNAVPEPATLLLMGGGLAGAIWRRRMAKKA